MKTIFLLSCLVFLQTSIAWANNYHVTNTHDSGAGSLRAAIDSANSHRGIDSILVLLSSSDTIHLTSGQLSITDSLVITGQFCNNTTVDGSGNSAEAFFVTALFTLNNINLLNFKYQTVNSGGAAVNSDATLYLNNCYFYNNQSSEPCLEGPGWGGAVGADTIYANNCSFYQNGSSAIGAPSNYGGAVACYAGHFENCVFYQNYSASNYGGAIFMQGGSVHHCIFTGNFSDAGGALAIMPPRLPCDVSNSIFWKDSTIESIDDREILFWDGGTSGGCNVISDTTNSGLVLTDSDAWGLDPQLGPFGYYGGCVPTFPVSNPMASSVFDSCKILTPDTCIPSQAMLYDTICQGYTAYVGVYAYTITGVYTDTLTNSGGCDSIVTLNLTVNLRDTINMFSGLCAGDSIYFYGRYLHSAGAYDTLLTGGCDTLVILDIAVQDPLPPTSIYDTICTNTTVFFNGIYLDTTGTYIAHYSALNGCDSSVILRLTVNSTPAVSLSWYSMVAAGWLLASTNDTGNCIWGPGSNFPYTPGGQTFILLSGGNPFGGIYAGHGVVNDTVYNNADFETRLGSMDTITYTYVNTNGCGQSISNSFYADICVEGINGVSSNPALTLYPNPANDYIFIDFDPAFQGAVARLYDMTGREIYSTKLISSPQQLSTGDLAEGVYLVTVSINGQSRTKLLVKQ